MSVNQTIVTIGEILVEFVSHNRGCALQNIGPYSGPYPSGAPAIFIDQAARMGAQTQMFGGIGDDGFGRATLQRLIGDGVNTDGITVSPGRSTGVAFVSYYDDGTRDFIFHLENTAADHFHVADDSYSPADTLLHVSASALGNARMRTQILKVARRVVAAGGQISCDPNARPELMRDAQAKDALHEMIALSTYLLPSTSDLDFLYPDMSEEAAVDQLLQSTAKIVVIKRGAAGATVVDGDQRYDFAGHDVDEVDPTGAGDCFCGTFLSLLSRGASPEDAGCFANAAGALAVTKRGPMEGNSSPNEIRRFLEMNNPETSPS